MGASFLERRTVMSYVGPNTLKHFVQKYFGDPDNIKGLGDGTVTSAIKAVSTKANTNATNISTVQGKVNTNANNISSLTTKVNGHTSSISQINTDLSALKNKKWLLKTGVFPLGVTGIIFTVLSFKNPISGVSQSVMESLSGTYDISLWAAVPAIVLLVLPWMKVSVSNTILISAITSFVVAVIFQNQSPAALVTYMVTGYELDSAALGDVMAGGGVISMVEVMIVVILSSSYAGIFEETGMLNSLKDKMDKAIRRAMTEDLSWDRSADEYMNLYTQLETE